MSGIGPWGEGVWLADCLEAMRQMPDACIDLVEADPPYAISEYGSIHVRMPGRGRRKLDFFPGDADWKQTIDGLVIPAVKETIRLLKPKGSAYWWCSHRQIGPIVDTLEAVGFSTRLWGWKKAAPAPPPPHSGWGSALEVAVYAYKPGRTWNDPPMPCANVVVADSFRHGQPGKVDHPTQKPEAVIEPHILASSNPGDLVLDCFAGSGTTGVVCIRTGRRFVGFEVSPEYHAIATQRLEEARQDARDAAEAARTGLSLRDYRAGQMSLWGNA